MTHTYIQPGDQTDALGAYALHALPLEEERAFEAFLVAHADIRDDFAITEEAVAMLPLLIEPVAPPPQLRNRILAQVYADATDGQTLLPQTDDPAAGFRAPLSMERVRQRRQRFSGASLAVAAVFLAVTIGFGSWVSVLQGDLQARNQVIAQQQQQITQAGGGSTLASTRPEVPARGELLRLSNTQTSVLTISGLPPLSQGKVYQVWFIDGSTPVGAGLFAPGTDGSWRGVVTGDVTRARAIAITVEPDGGSPAPTGDIIVKGSL